MADYRKRIDPPAQYKNMFGDRSKKPLSVQMAEVGVEFTPAGTIFGLNDIKEELQKEEPDYYKIGMMAGLEALGIIPGLSDAAVAAIKAGAKKAGLDKVADQTDVLLGGPKPNPELEIFGGAKAQYPPNMTGYGSIDSAFNAEADFKTLENLSIDFEDDPTGSLVRVMDELERNPSKYPATLKEVVAGNWFRGRDDLMRFEIDDSQSEILGNGVGDIVRMDEDDMDAYLRGFSFNVDNKFPDNSIQGMPEEQAFSTLGNILKHDQLYNQYPQLRDAPVIEDTAYFKRNPSVLGYFDDSSGTIAINTNKITTNEELRDTLLHEVQHLVQHLEGFESGTNVRNADVLEIKKAVEGSPEYQKAFTDYNAKVSEYLKNRDSATVAVYNKNKEVASKVLDIILDDFSNKTQIPVEEIYERLNKGETFDQIKMSVPSNIRARGFVYSPEFEQILHIAEGNVGGMAPNSSIDLNRSLDDVNPRESAAPYFEMLSGKDKIDLIADNNRWQQNRLSMTISSLIKDNPELAKDFENSLGFSAQDFIDAKWSQDGVGKLYGIPDVVPPTKPKVVRNYVIYSSKRGEVEARNVSARKDMAASERTPENVFDTEDTPANRQWGEPELKRARSGQNPVTGFANGPSASSLTLEDFGYRVDNPSKEWSEKKQKQAEFLEKVDKTDPNKKVTLLTGPQTAFLGTDPEKPLFLDTDFLAKLPGANKEVRKPGISKYDDLMAEVQRRGFDPKQRDFYGGTEEEARATWRDGKIPESAVMVGVNHKGEAFLLEGNTRTAIAKDLGIPNLKVEVKYYNGAEEVDGPYSPQNILKYASQAPRQFAKGGSPRPKLRPEGFANATSPRPRLRPSEDEVRYVDAVFRGEDGDIITSPEENNPVTMLGLTRGDTFRQYPNDLNIYGAYLKPSDKAEGGPHKSELQDFYAREKPDSPPLLINDILIAGKSGVENRYTAAHEFMHRGFNILRNRHDFDEVSERFGRATAQILFSENNPRLEHALLQAILEKEGKIAGIDYTSKDYLKGVSKETRDKLNKSVEDIYELSNETLGEAGYQTDRDRGPTTRQGRRGAKPKSFWSFITEKLGFAEGGTVDMNQQMSFAFEDGGLRDDGMRQDPVSGNEVPSGSMASEVRDDIPAQLSEGEYVVPADVVRYYGVKFFEDLRDNAKMGLQDMEARGRIGGEPVPAGGPTNNDDLSAEELSAIKQMMGMNIGGFVDTPMYNADPYAQQQSQYTVPMQMNKGGPVRGYQPGGGVTAQDNVSSKTMEDYFLKAANLTGQNKWMMPLGSTIFPDANTGKTIFQPTQQTAETLIYLYGPNGEVRSFTSPLSDADKKIYEDLIAQGYTTEKPETLFEPEQMGSGGDDDKPPKTETETDSTGWMDKFDYTDSKKLAEQTLNSLTPAMGGITGGLSKIGAIGTFANGTKSAQAAANIILLDSQGYDTTSLKEALQTFNRQTGVGSLPNFMINGDSFARAASLKSGILLGKDAVDIFGKPIFKDETDYQKFRTQWKEIAPFKAVQNANLQEMSTKQNQVKTAEAMQKKDDDQNLALEALKAAQESAKSGSTADIVEKSGEEGSPNREQTEQNLSDVLSGLEIGSKTGTIRLNQGGLMTTPKPKKKRGRPRKSGLAGKK